MNKYILNILAKTGIVNVIPDGRKMMVYSLLIMLFTFNSVTLSAQYKLDQEVSFLYINGTSTLHDWTLVAEQMQGSLNAEIGETGIKRLGFVQITIPVISLKSGKPGMDDNMNKALKSNQFPEISYILKNHTIDKSEMTVTGELTIAGVSKTISSKISHEDIGKHIKFNGELTINMSDFGIKPPEFLLGAFKTGDKITIKFYFMFCDQL